MLGDLDLEQGCRIFEDVIMLIKLIYYIGMNICTALFSYTAGQVQSLICCAASSSQL